MPVSSKFEIIKLFISYNYNVNCINDRGNTPLWEALLSITMTNNVRKDLVKYVIKNNHTLGIDLEMQHSLSKDNILTFLASKNAWFAVNLLVANGANFSYKNGQGISACNYFSKLAEQQQKKYPELLKLFQNTELSLNQTKKRKNTKISNNKNTLFAQTNNEQNTNDPKRAKKENNEIETSRFPS
ncbi:MAG: hypothetical protein HYX60_06945 [Legionella longbeachae]|nr:hypothetical protein [Legionella longbeachae]